MKFFKSQFHCAHWYGGAVIDLFNGSSVSIHHQNIRQPAIEMFKISKGVITEFLKVIFELQTNCLIQINRKV